MVEAILFLLFCIQMVLSSSDDDDKERKEGVEIGNEGQSGVLSQQSHDRAGNDSPSNATNYTDV